MVNSGATPNKMSAKSAISAISPPVGGLLASIASRGGRRPATGGGGGGDLGACFHHAPVSTGARASSYLICYIYRCELGQFRLGVRKIIYLGELERYSTPHGRTGSYRRGEYSAGRSYTAVRSVDGLDAPYPAIVAVERVSRMVLPKL
jgi:hypothetical protein